jgi:hypothetical protein
MKSNVKMCKLERLPGESNLQRKMSSFVGQQSSTRPAHAAYAEHCCGMVGLKLIVGLPVLVVVGLPVGTGEDTADGAGEDSSIVILVGIGELSIAVGSLDRITITEGAALGSAEDGLKDGWALASTEGLVDEPSVGF